MKDNRLGGIALIIGAVSGMITMSLHPVAGAHPITPAQFEKLATLMIGVHVLAIAGMPFSFLGALALDAAVGFARSSGPCRIGHLQPRFGRGDDCAGD